MQASAVIVTKGDQDLGPILASLRSHFDDVVIWDNSERENLMVYGRYAALKEAKHSVIYTQDDDCVISDPLEVIAAHEPGQVVCNMPVAKREEYDAIAPNLALVGWGCCFDAALTGVLDRYIERYGKDELFLRECDRVFTGLNAHKFIDVKFVNRPHAFSSRMGNERRHLGDLAEIQKRIKALTAE